MRAYTQLLGLAVAGIAAAAFISSCDQQGNLDASKLKTADQALNQDAVCYDGDPACTPTGAHAKHGTYACSVCHKVAGRLVFDKDGPAYAAGYPKPFFDATAKTCSNVACHTIPPGNFTYGAQGGDGEPVEVTVSYGGGAPKGTPSWYSTGAACGACHAMPAELTSPAGVPAWHSGRHGSPTQLIAHNSCNLCHPDATGYYTVTGSGASAVVTNTAAISTATNCGPSRNLPCAGYHGNAALNVSPVWNSRCFDCH